jgi:hypothetical protein
MSSIQGYSPPAFPLGISTPAPDPARAAILPPPEVLPDRGINILSNLTPEVTNRISSYVWPPVQNGQGYMSQLNDAVSRLDLVRGMDRTLGKTDSIPPGKKAGQHMKIIGPMSTQEALGRLSGRLTSSPYSRMFDTVV